MNVATTLYLMFGALVVLINIFNLDINASYLIERILFTAILGGIFVSGYFVINSYVLNRYDDKYS